MGVVWSNSPSYSQTLNNSNISQLKLIDVVLSNWRMESDYKIMCGRKSEITATSVYSFAMNNSLNMKLMVAICRGHFDGRPARRANRDGI